MDKISCLECKKEFKNETSFHRHLKKDGLSKAGYYQKHFPRYDKFNKSIISFKSKDQYFSSDFNSLANLKAWFSAASPHEAREYVSNYLSKRKKDKRLIYTPTQVEFRSLRFPGLVYLNGLFGNFNSFASSLGFKNRFDKTTFSNLSNISKEKIVVDTREQKPLKFSLKTVSRGLTFGDYRLENDLVSHDCYIERKSLGDFYSTVTMGIDRFRNELGRCKEAGAYMVILIEEPLDNVFTYMFRPYLFKKIGILPEYVFHGMRELIFEFDNIQFLFVDSREEASRVIEKIFASKGECKRIDLQRAYDSKVL